MIDDSDIDIDEDIELDVEFNKDKVTLLSKDLKSILKRLDYYRNKDIDRKTYTHCCICNVGLPTEHFKCHKLSEDHIRKKNKN